MAKTTVNQDLCKGCSLCVSVCPKGIMKIDDTTINNKGYHPSNCINQSECIGCTFCALICPDVAITVER